MGISVQAVGIFVLPGALWGDLIIGLVPCLLSTNIIGAFLLFHLIHVEFSFVSAAAESRKDASTDHLTGLSNRHGLDLVYPEMASTIENTSGWGLLCFDMDRIKHINDTYGHGVGDAVLRHVAERVTDNLRPHDVFARLGGDEFVVILNRIDRDEAERIANRCRAVVAGGGFIHQGEILPISTSIGGIWMFDHFEIARFLEEADKALYAAKTRGRDKVVFKVGLGGAHVDMVMQPA